jgi:diacylglycerol kinase family enzyme
MRVSLLYNERAGDGQSVGSLREALEANGHEVLHLIEKDAELDRVVDDKTIDLVVAAGGDGTVRRAAQALSGRPIPLALIPIGTANNIAKSLRISGSVPQIIETWKHATEVALDLGLIRGSWGECLFLEGVGGGLIPAGIVAMKSMPERQGETVEAELQRAVQVYAGVLADLRPQKLTITVDGVETERELLLLEVLNMPTVGPNLWLSPDISPADRFFSVVATGTEHRKDLAHYLESRLKGIDTPALPIPAQRAQRVEIRGWDRMHVDDEVREGPDVGDVSIEIQPGTLKVLAPAAASVRSREA